MSDDDRQTNPRPEAEAVSSRTATTLCLIAGALVLLLAAWALVWLWAALAPQVVAWLCLVAGVAGFAGAVALTAYVWLRLYQNGRRLKALERQLEIERTAAATGSYRLTASDLRLDASRQDRAR